MLTYNGESFEYDSLGNPTTYRGKSLVWGHLRNLEKFSDIASYKYNASGIRTSKTVGNKTTKFYLNGNKIVAQDDNANKLYFHYGVDGLVGFTLRKDEDTLKDYYYKKNIQGDILSIYDENYNEIARYIYDAWGNQKIEAFDGTDFVDINSNKVYTDDSEFNNNKFIAELNPFRYRSYYYDNETDLYYLNSRYYDPEIGKFINSDNIEYINLTKSFFNGINLYIYANNNPIKYIDSNGNLSIINPILLQKNNLGSSQNKKQDIANIVEIAHNTKSKSLIGGFFGQYFFDLTVSGTTSVASKEKGNFYLLKDYGNDYNSFGAGINNSNWFGLEMGVHSSGMIYTKAQISPYLHIEAGLGIEGISLSLGVESDNVSGDVTLNIGWGTIAIVAVAAVTIAAAPAVAVAFTAIYKFFKFIFC